MANNKVLQKMTWYMKMEQKTQQKISSIGNKNYTLHIILIDTYSLKNIWRPTWLNSASFYEPSVV